MLQTVYTLNCCIRPQARTSVTTAVLLYVLDTKSADRSAHPHTRWPVRQHLVHIRRNWLYSVLLVRVLYSYIRTCVQSAWQEIVLRTTRSSSLLCRYRSVVATAVHIIGDADRKDLLGVDCFFWYDFSIFQCGAFLAPFFASVSGRRRGAASSVGCLVRALFLQPQITTGGAPHFI